MTSIVRWEPFRDLVSLREAMDRLFEESFVQPRTRWSVSGAAEALPLDMYETDDAVVVQTAVAGVKPEDIDISVTGDVLTIRGETATEDEVEKEAYIRRERRCGAFQRSVAIPVSIVAEKAEAEFENGVLTLTLPKAEEIKPKAIKVTARGR